MDLNESTTKMKEQGQVVTAPELPRYGFVKGIFKGLKSLLEGMKITFHYFSHPSTVVTQQYPENRETLKMFERFRSQLSLTHDETGAHKCTGCKICETACPNASIVVVPRTGPVTGKKEIDRYIWRMDACTFCNACVQSCPFGALRMEGAFEAAVYDRRLFVYTLNRYAGPPANVLAKITDAEERKKMMEPRDVYGGDIPLRGKSMGGLSAGNAKSDGEGEKK